jgi:hypothetical protein
MQNYKNLLLVESEMVKAKGHFLDYLIETSNYFKKNNKITWFLNNNFDSQNLYLPDYCNIKKVINSNNFKRKNNKFMYFMEEIYFFFLNFYHIFFFSFYFKKQPSKLYSFYKCLFKNYLIIPRYFKSFYLEYVKLNFNSSDNIFFQSCRRKDIALIYFLANIEKNNQPKIHLRVFLPPNKRFKDFYFYLNKLKNKLQNNIFLYTEDGYKKDLISKQIGNPELVNTTTPIFNFYTRNIIQEKHVIGFIGEARANKGFNKIPKLIEILNREKNKFEYIIQFSGTNDETKLTSEMLFDLSKQHKNIKIVNKYCDYQEYRKILENITIMPFIYDAAHMNNTNSGIIYSCISNEIITIIPTNCDYLKKILSINSFLEADNLESYANQINYVSNNYNFFLKNAKKSSKNFSDIINNGEIVRNINQSN